MLHFECLTSSWLYMHTDNNKQLIMYTFILVTDKENDIRDKEITQKVWPQSVISLPLSLCPSNL